MPGTKLFSKLLPKGQVKGYRLHQRFSFTRLSYEIGSPVQLGKKPSMKENNTSHVYHTDLGLAPKMKMQMKMTQTQPVS